MIHTIYEAFLKKWEEEGFINTDDRMEVYFQRSIKVPFLFIEDRIHFVFVFPGQDNDYQINISAKRV